VACWRPATGDPPTRTGRLRARAITGAAVLALLDAAIADLAFSHGEFFVGPGPHAIEFENKALWSETSTGTGAYFRVDSVAVAKSDCQQAGWMNYGNLFKNQGACLTVAS
jgi:hypothetical protein